MGLYERPVYGFVSGGRMMPECKECGEHCEAEDMKWKDDEPMCEDCWLWEKGVY